MPSTQTSKPQRARRRTFVNFGGNRVWRCEVYRPRDEAEVLEILARHRAARIRAMGSLHSWSAIAEVRDVALDMGHFRDVQPFTRDGGTFVRVGAGCTLQELLDRLHAATDRTLPTLGVIKRQTVAGVISTATHGSGRPGISHFVTAVRIAAYDSRGRPRVFEHREGDALRAARCALGCMGVILAVELATVAKYRVRETVRRLDHIDTALRLYPDHPLTQFVLVPHSWTIIAWERHSLPPGGHARGRLTAWLFRGFNLIGVDVVSHLLLKASLIAGEAAVKALLKALPRLLIADRARVDDAERVLTLRHDLFRHEEMELFVPESKIVAAARLLRVGIEVFAGDLASIPADVERRLRAAGLYDELMRGHGSYLHHYPILFRRVLPEDTLLSMASSTTEAWFSFSLFTFKGPGDREPYYRLCSWFARAMHALFDARLHWGKYFPLGGAETAQAYPNLEKFRRLRRSGDPSGVFRNAFVDRVLGLK